MKIEKFLEKILQDERVEKIEYEKRLGYTLYLKKGYGVLRNSTSTHWFGYDYVDFPCIKIEDWVRESSQSDIEWFLTKVEKYNVEDLEIKNKKSELQSMKKFLETTKRMIRSSEIDIQNSIKIKESYENRKSSIENAIKEFEKEVEAYGTAEQL